MRLLAIILLAINVYAMSLDEAKAKYEELAKRYTKYVFINQQSQDYDAYYDKDNKIEYKKASIQLKLFASSKEALSEYTKIQSDPLLAKDSYVKKTENKLNKYALKVTVYDTTTVDKILSTYKGKYEMVLRNKEYLTKSIPIIKVDDTNITIPQDKVDECGCKPDQKPQEGAICKGINKLLSVVGISQTPKEVTPYTPKSITPTDDRVYIKTQKVEDGVVYTQIDPLAKPTYQLIGGNDEVLIEATDTNTTNIEPPLIKKPLADVIMPSNDDIDITKDLVFSIDSSIKSAFNKISVAKEYNLTLKETSTQASLDVINNLSNSKATIGIARGDVLGIKNSALYGFEPFTNYGILCQPNNSLLYIVAKRDITSIYDFRGANVSTGLVGNIAQVYLQSIMQSSGLDTEINYLSYDLDSSIMGLNDGSIDIIFLFGSISDIDKIKQHNLHISSIPSDMMQVWQNKQGLEQLTYSIGANVISTYSTPNYIVAPLTTLDINLATKIEAVVKKFECYKKVQNIDKFYGNIHPLVLEIFKKIQDSNVVIPQAPKIEIALSQILQSNSKKQYTYIITNNTAEDANVTFDYYKTKAFDTSSIKPHHLISYTPKDNILVKAKESKPITFVYHNPFTAVVRESKIGLVFRDTTHNQEINTTITIGDNQ